MKLAFLDRSAELARLERAFDARDGSLVVLYGRRRLGKSRLLQEALRGRPAAYFVGDDRDAALHREHLARELAASIEGFDQVSYPDWSALLERWWREAPSGTVLALDEFPSLARRSPELPSLLQRLVDLGEPRSLALCGSSQRMMHGVVLDGSAPLYGRAREILRVQPLDARWLQRALGIRSPAAVVDHWAAWGGVPRYWELAADYADRRTALRELALDPLGVLHREPERLLLDDLDDVARASSILSLVGRGAHRASEIAGRIGVPSTSLSRPIALLVDLGLLERESPWSRDPKRTKQSRYHIVDPFLRSWFRFVEPNRSRLESGQLDAVASDVEARWPEHVGEAWKDLARKSVARLERFGHRWRPAARWWGAGLDRRPLEIDLVAESEDDPGLVLCGEVKRSGGARDVARVLRELEDKAARCPDLLGRSIRCAVWVLRPASRPRREEILTARDVV